MVKMFFSLLLVSCLFYSCGSGGTPESMPTDSPSAAPDKPYAKDSLPPTVTSPQDMGDDSVFTDGSVPSSWANAGFDDPVAFKKFLRRFQSWVTEGQKDSVAAVIRFPLPKGARDKSEFLARYDQYMSEKVKAALARQNFRQIFRNAQGAMVGNGQIWFIPSNNGYTVIAINNQ